MNFFFRASWHTFIGALISDDTTVDTQSMRGLLRHHLTHATEGIVLATLVTAALMGLGNTPLFLILGGYTGAWILTDLLVTRSDIRVSPLLGFRLATATWPAAFVVLGAAGWSGAAYHGEVVALIGLLVAGMVALVHTLPTTVLWTLAGTGGISIGAALGGPLGQQHVLAVAGVLAGAAFGNRMRQVIEDFLGRRKRLLHEVTRVPSSPDPYVMAAGLLEPLTRHTPLKTASITWFTADGRSVLLGIVGTNLSPYLRAGAVLPEHRNEYFRTHAASGPWITGWTVQEEDGGYSRSVAAMGVDAVVFMPLSYEGRMIGLLGAAVSNPAGGQATVAEHIPVLAEMADVVATTLGPAIAKLEERSSATHLIDEILLQRRYWPVFQPIRDIVSNQVVGYEALTRFDAPQTTMRLFDMPRSSDGAGTWSSPPCRPPSGPPGSFLPTAGSASTRRRPFCRRPIRLPTSSGRSIGPRSSSSPNTMSSPITRRSRRRWNAWVLAACSRWMTLAPASRACATSWKYARPS